MSQSVDQSGSGHDAATAKQPDPLSPSEGLPEVKAPDTGFLMQLFVYPLAIVCSIAIIVVFVQWVSASGGDPYRHLAALGRDKHERWRAAHDLAIDMASSNESIKDDSQFAARLAAILDRELDKHFDDKHAQAESINLRLYLCQALGEFRVDDPLPALLRATREQVADDEVAVRCTAIGAIARLAANLRPIDPIDPIDSPEVIETLLEASRDDDAAVVRNAAFALGTIGGRRAIERLKELTAFGNHSSVRYNAAVKLATLGEAASVEVLLEMLDLENDATTEIDYVDVDGKVEQLDEEKDKRLIEQLRANSRAAVLLNALRAASQLAQKNSSVDLGELIEAVEAVAAAELRKQLPRDKADAIHDKAAEVLAQLMKN